MSSKAPTGGALARGWRDLAAGFTTLLYPRLCLNCRRPVGPRQTAQLCAGCWSQLSFTEYWTLPANPLTDRLAGRVPLTFGAGLLHYHRGNVTQRLIYALKYHHRPEIGVELGQLLGERLREVAALADLTGVVPVPIHGRRRHERGYNQAERIAAGVSNALGVRVYPQALRRREFRGSQTRRNRYERVDNTAQAFGPGRGDFRGGHLLLVDDVATTGATLDFCANTLLAQHPDLRLSVATLALTE